MSCECIRFVIKSDLMANLIWTVTRFFIDLLPEKFNEIYKNFGLIVNERMKIKITWMKLQKRYQKYES